MQEQMKNLEIKGPEPQHLPVGRPHSTAVSAPTEAARRVVAEHLARAHERQVLTSPGVSEGFDHVSTLIEEWKRPAQ